MAKKRVGLNIDEEIWELLELKLPCSRSSFFERQARAYILGNNNLEELKKELKETEAKVSSLKTEIDRLEKLQKANDNNKEIIEMAMITVRKFAFKNGSIGKNNIKNIASINGLSYEALENKIKSENITISNFGIE